MQGARILRNKSCLFCSSGYQPHTIESPPYGMVCCKDMVWFATAFQGPGAQAKQGAGHTFRYYLPAHCR